MTCDVIKTDCLLFSPVSIKNSQFWSMRMTLKHLKTNSAKFARYRPKIQKVIEFFEFRSLTQHPFEYKLVMSFLTHGSSVGWFVNLCHQQKWRNYSIVLLPLWTRLPCGHYATFQTDWHVTCRHGRGLLFQFLLQSWWICSVCFGVCFYFPRPAIMISLAATIVLSRPL